MTHKRYENYVDTQEAWLGSYPSHWGRKPLWTLFRRVKRQGFESEELLSVYRDHGVIPKSSREDNFNKPSDDLGAYQLVEPGDLAVNKMKAWQGSVAISEHRGIVSPAYHVYTPLHSENQRFLHYLMRCDRYITGYLSISKGIRINQWDLQPEYHSRMPVLLPPLEEQIVIASFLDRETAKIDGLIVEQKHLIELLQEKRQAVISHAVTKGLNPNAPMKDSGVEWLGEVPEHWEILKGSRIGYVFGSEQMSEDKVHREGEIAFVKVSTLDDNTFEILDPEWFVFRSDVKARFGSQNFLAFPKRGAAIFGNKVNLVNIEALIDPNLMGWKIADGGDPIYYAYLLKTKKLEQIADVSTVPQINTKHIAQEPWPRPPSDEQDEIVHFLSKETTIVDSMVEEVARAVSLLQERRSALISAAVTGQIDVRGLTEEVAA